MKPRHERLAEQIRLTKLLPQAKEELMKYPGVRDVGVGLRERNDLATDEIVFRVYVTDKKPPSKLPKNAMIPDKVLGVPTDIVLEPRPRLTDDSSKYRPLQGGIQIGNDTTSGAGTIACIAQRNTDGSIVVLSNGHVLLDGGAANGEKVGQPNISCCCCCKGNIIGEVVDTANNSLVDCGIALIKGQPGFTNEIQDIGLIFGSAPLNGAGSTVVFGDKVRKRGRSTRLTHGTIMNASVATAAVPAKGIPARTNQIEIKPDPAEPMFQDYGDSGAALVNEDNVVVGLMWGVVDATKLAYANRITDVISAMNITIINSGTAGTIPLGSAPSAEEQADIGVDDAPLREISRVLERSENGRRVLELFDRHGHEINDLLNDNREVKVAWHRFQGPSFTAHVLQSAREPDHRIPPEIEGVTPANLLIRMSVVLQDQGSPALAEAVDAHTLPLLELLSSVTSVRVLLERFPAEDDTVDVVDALPAASA